MELGMLGTAGMRESRPACELLFGVCMWGFAHLTATSVKHIASTRRALRIRPAGAIPRSGRSSRLLEQCAATRRIREERE